MGVRLPLDAIFFLVTLLTYAVVFQRDIFLQLPFGTFAEKTASYLKRRSDPRKTSQSCDCPLRGQAYTNGTMVNGKALGGLDKIH